MEVAQAATEENSMLSLNDSLQHSTRRGSHNFREGRRTLRSGVWQEVTEPPLRGEPCPGWITVTSTMPSATAAAVQSV